MHESAVAPLFDCWTPARRRSIGQAFKNWRVKEMCFLRTWTRDLFLCLSTPRSLSSHWIEVASKLGTSKLSPELGKFSPCSLSTRQCNSKEAQGQGCFPRIRGSVVAEV